MPEASMEDMGSTSMDEGRLFVQFSERAAQPDCSLAFVAERVFGDRLNT
jgi:hypothetical protein